MRVSKEYVLATVIAVIKRGRFTRLLTYSFFIPRAGESISESDPRPADCSCLARSCGYFQRFQDPEDTLWPHRPCVVSCLYILLATGERLSPKIRLLYEIPEHDQLQHACKRLDLSWRQRWTLSFYRDYALNTCGID
jgi:hypothetical protein